MTEAEIHARAALRLYEAMEDADGLVAATIELADLANQRGDHADERRLLQAALERASAPRRAQLILTRLGHLARDAGHRDAAIDYLGRAAAASERVRTHRLAHAERDRVMAARQQTYDALLDALLRWLDPEPDWGPTLH